MARLRDRRALVTGGSRGIGRAITTALAREGADVVFNHLHDADGARETADAVRAFGRRAADVDADLGDRAALDRLVDEAVRFLGGLDILVSNAGICPFTPFRELSWETWDRTFAVNLHAPFRLARLAAEQMIRQGRGGRILFTTSISAYRSNAGQVHYGATKAALENLMKGIALELAPFGITVNAVSPGTIKTDINREFFSDPAREKAYAARTPLGRLGVPEDCAGAAVFLAGDEASWITGSALVIDGGWTAQL